MQVVKYWAKSQVKRFSAAGKAMALACWGWSSESREAAVEMAESRAARAAERAVKNGDLENNYPYGVNPIREAVIREGNIGPDGSPDFIITQNSYGCFVINSARMMFVDVDIDPDEAAESANSGSFFSSISNFLFGAPAARGSGTGGKTPLEKVEEKYTDLLRKAAESDPAFNARVYRTAGGLRYIITHREYLPESDETTALLKALSSDPMYIKLCARQKTFRARLSPKSWRCGVPKIHICYPFENNDAEKALETWMRSYNAAGKSHAACKFLYEVGNGSVDRRFDEMIRLHDQMSRADSGLKLA